MTNAEKFFSANCRGSILDLSAPKIMGILNLTPDSFSDGGKFSNEKNALKHAEKMIADGAEIIDIGPQSTRPNAEKISAKEEIARIGSVISSIKKKFPQIFISLDTFYAETLRYGYGEGVDIANDISAGSYDKKLLKTAAELRLPYILMHVNDGYAAMHEKKIIGNIIIEENRYFSEKILRLREIGIKDVILDPGFGFGKTLEQNLQLVDHFQHLGFGENPLLAGISRKSFIYKPLRKNPLEVGEETRRLHLRLLEKGAKILRVHDVAAARETILEFVKNKKERKSSAL